MQSPSSCLILETPRSRGGQGYVVVTGMEAPGQDEILDALQRFKSEGDRGPYPGVSRKVVIPERTGTSRSGEETLLILPPDDRKWTEEEKAAIRADLGRLLNGEIDSLITGDGVGRGDDGSLLTRDPRLDRIAEELALADYHEDPASSPSPTPTSTPTTPPSRLLHVIFIAVAILVVLGGAVLVFQGGDEKSDNDLTPDGGDIGNEVKSNQGDSDYGAIRDILKILKEDGMERADDEIERLGLKNKKIDDSDIPELQKIRDEVFGGDKKRWDNLVKGVTHTTEHSKLLGQLFELKKVENQEEPQ